jgi:hypothetical protein
VIRAGGPTVLLLTLLLMPAAADEPAAALAKKMLPIYVREAEAYKIAVASAPDRPLELKKEPVFEWSNPVREGVQQGAVFVWLRDGRPAAVGCIFSQPQDKPQGRKLTHELHALDPEKLVVTRPADVLNQWAPRAGLERKPLPDAPAPAATPGTRLIQMRRLAQEFTGYTVDREGKRWDLRLLPAPLYRYPAAKAGVVDGALFTLISEAGTDPEVLVLIEAKEAGGKLTWEYALGRFSDRDLHVARTAKEVWSSVRNDTDTFNNDPLHLYRLYADKVVDLDGKLLARVKATEKMWWGEVIPVTNK